MERTFNSEARQFLNRFRHIILREDFGGLGAGSRLKREYDILHLEDELQSCGLMLYMESPYFTGVDIAFQISHQSLKYEVFADAAIDDQQSIVEADIPFSLIPEKLMLEYEHHKDLAVKSQIIDILMKSLMDEGFTFIDNGLGRHSFEQIFDHWYREEIETRPQNLRTWQFPLLSP